MNSLLIKQIKAAFSSKNNEEGELWLDDILNKTALLDNHDASRLTTGLSALLASIDNTYRQHGLEAEDETKSGGYACQNSMDRQPLEQGQTSHQELAAITDNLVQSVNTLLTAQARPEIDNDIASLTSLSTLVLDLITEQQHNENDMLIQRRAMDQHSIVVTLDLNGTILSANDKCCQLSEFTRDELIGNNADMLNVKNVPLPTRLAILKSLFEGEIWHGELQSITKSGTPWFVFCTIVPNVNDQDRVENLVVLCTDISNQKRLEKRLETGRQFYQSITNSIGEGVYAVDANGKTQFLNPEASRLLGWELEDLQSHRFHNAVHYQKEDGTLLSREDCAVNNAICEGKTYSSDEDFFTDKRGRIFPISIVAVPLQDIHGKPNGHVGVFRDISGRKRLERQLQHAYQEAAKANKAKGDFLATMSHEIRTPMNAIIGLTHLALESDNQAQQQNYMSKVRGSATSLLTLINGILDFSKVEAQQIELHHADFNLADMMNKLAQVFQHKARQKHLQLLFDMRLDTDVTCKGDSDKIYQVLVNLLGNAIKFTRHGFVKLIVSQEGEALSFCVSDTGIGIDEDNKEKLFKAFVQADASISREYGGTGLGLAISKRLVELMHGELEFTSELGKGTNFCFTLPGMVYGKAKEIGREKANETISINASQSVPIRELNHPLLCVNTSQDMDEANDILAHTLSRLSIPCSFIKVNADADAFPVTPHDVIVLLPAKPAAWQKFVNHIKLGEYENLNLMCIVTPVDTEEAKRRLQSIKLNTLNIIELPFTDVHILRALFPTSGSTLATHADGLESKIWRKRRLAGKHALLVDDDSISLEIAQQILLDAGLKVTTATTGEQALALGKSKNFDVVLLDCILPNKSGFTVAEELNNLNGWHFPIIALSADGSSENIRKGSSVGMCAHLLKPASAAEILHVIDINIHTSANLSNMHDSDDPYLTSLAEFYLNYGNAELLAQLINIMVENDSKHDAINSLLDDARKIGADTLVAALEELPSSLENKANYAHKISNISFALDATLRLIAHTLSLPKEYDEKEVEETLSISDLSAVITSLESYDAEAVSLLSALYNKHASSTSASVHALNHARQLVSVYDYGRALEELLRLRDTLLNG
ncbi:hybrid sensor histidine kinase/response regulator [Alteromonas stellipolaris]|uniref:hybrid sensor histidine kinase/response regulator n=2 Tax=Alteromonas TaxID=226 RepID=UPI0027347E5E|nr:ATP-binding protein [Alteromonas stellipolaris]MDP2536568.1 ATP-binding protein [Alteromonas stellipolaris]